MCRYFHFNLSIAYLLLLFLLLFSAVSHPPKLVKNRFLPVLQLCSNEGVFLAEVLFYKRDNV